MVFPVPVPPLTRVGHAGLDQGPQDAVTARRHGARLGQLRPGSRRGAHDPQRQAGRADRHRGQHRVHGGCRRAAARPPRAGVVEPASRDRREPLREPADGGGVGEGHRGPFETGAPVHPHPVGRRDQDVGDRRVGEQRFQRSGPDQFGPELLGRAEHLRVAEEPPLGPQRRRHPRRCGFGAARREPLPHGVEQSRTAGPGPAAARDDGPGHAAPPGARARSQKAAQNRPSAPRGSPPGGTPASWSATIPGS